MKFATKFVFLLTLLVSSLAFGQKIAPYVQGTAASAPGANKLDYTVGVGLESNTKYLLLDANGSFNSANVLNGAGYTGTLQGSGYFKFFGHILAGGGANWVINTNGFNAKQFVNTARESANPFVGAGVQLGRFRTIATYQLPGKDALVHERLINLTGELKLTKHLRAVGVAGVNSYLDGLKPTVASIKTLPGRVTVAQAGGGLKFVF